MVSPTMATGVGGGTLGGAAAGGVFGPIGAIIGALAGAGLGAFGAYESGAGQRNEMNYRANVALINQQIQERNAATARVVAGGDAMVEGIKYAGITGGERVRTAAGGLDTESGSAKAVRRSTTELDQYSQANIRNRGEQQAYGFETEAFGQGAQANLDVAAGRGLYRAGGINAGSSLLGGATNVADKWAKFGEAYGSGQPFQTGAGFGVIGPYA